MASSVAIMAALFAALLLCSRGIPDQGLANTPPRGWNSYDSYSWIISEQEFLQNAQLVADNLLSFGYEYVVLDFLWYRKRSAGASAFTAGYDAIDEWGRPIPDPERWPSSAGGKGLKPIADKVHAMGLKFGIHIMRGISTQAIKTNTPVSGAPGWRAADIALQNQPCPWMSTCFVSVNESTDGGRAFIQSLYSLYASWEVDLVKHDCVFGAGDLSVHEIEAVSQAIAATGRSIIYSISPGVQATPSMAMQINDFVNMYRVTGDDWDSWHDVQAHFNVARDFANAGLIGASGLNGLSWPDLDMLPLGYLTDPGAKQGPHRSCRLSLDEQRTQVTLWAIAKSPLMFGGDMRNLDQNTMALLTNRVVLDINAYSNGNRELQASNSFQEDLPVLRILKCIDANMTKWSIRSNTVHGQDQLCCFPSIGTKGSIEALAMSLGCLNWHPAIAAENPLLVSYTRHATSDWMRALGHGSLFISPMEELCLDSQADMILSNDFFRSKHLAHCSFHGSQTWKLNQAGKLVSTITEDCATITPAGFSENMPGGQEPPNYRIWIARGQQGEYYVAFFNLGSTANVIAIPLESIILGSRAARHDILDYSQILSDYKCTGQEVWSSQDLGVVETSLSALVSAHGCALFSLQCM